MNMIMTSITLIDSVFIHIHVHLLLEDLVTPKILVYDQPCSKLGYLSWIESRYPLLLSM